MKALIRLQRLAAPLTLAQLAFAGNTFVSNFFLAQSSTKALNAALPGSLLATTVTLFLSASLGYSGTILARRHGAGDFAGARAIFRIALLTTLGAIPLLALACPLGHFILACFNTSADVLQAETAYFDRLLVNGFVTTLATVLAGYFTGQGRTRFTGLVTVLGCVINMALAPVFILGTLPAPFQGISGAAWATTLANLVPCLIFAATILCQPLSAPSAPLSRKDLHELLRLGLPNGLRIVIDVGGFFLFVAILGECEVPAVAASAAAFALNGLFQAFPNGLAQGLEINVSRNHSDPRLPQHNLVRATILSLVYMCVFALVLLFFGKQTLFAFGSQTDSIVFERTASLLLLILAGKALLESAVLLLQAYLRGLGRTAETSRCQFIASILFWIPLFLSVRILEPSIPTLWLTMPACSLVNIILLKRTLSRANQNA